MSRHNDEINRRLANLIKENYSIIYQICRVYFPYDRYKQLNLYNDIVYRVWQGLENFRGKSSERAWIYRIAINTAINHYNSDLRSLNTIRITLDLAEFLPNEDDNQLIKQLYELIDKLNPLEKAVIFLYLDRKPQSEIGNILGLTETNVSTIIGRIKAKLKKMHDNEKQD